MARSLCLILLCIFPLTAWCDQLIIEPDMGRQPILNALESAQHSIQLVMYGFTDKAILDALINQKAKGKTIKVILERHPYKMTTLNDATIAAFKRYHINWQGRIPPYRLIHQKTLIVDNKRAIVMTFNFTSSSFKKERNFALVLDDAKTVHHIQNIFNADINKVSALNENPSILLSPVDSRKNLIRLIASSKRNIKIYAQSLSDFEIVGALQKAARRGVTVEIVTSRKLRDKQADYLQQANVKIVQSTKMYIHAKVMMIDDQLAVLGSINLTKASLDDNRELAVITRDANVLKQLDHIFKIDYAASTQPNKTKKEEQTDWSWYFRFVKKLVKATDHALDRLGKGIEFSKNVS